MQALRQTLQYRSTHSEHVYVLYRRAPVLHIVAGNAWLYHRLTVNVEYSVSRTPIDARDLRTLRKAYTFVLLCHWRGALARSNRWNQQEDATSCIVMHRTT